MEHSAPPLRDMTGSQLTPLVAATATNPSTGVVANIRASKLVLPSFPAIALSSVLFPDPGGPSSSVKRPGFSTCAAAPRVVKCASCLTYGHLRLQITPDYGLLGSALQ